MESEWRGRFRTAYQFCSGPYPQQTVRTVWYRNLEPISMISRLPHMKTPITSQLLSNLLHQQKFPQTNSKVSQTTSSLQLWNLFVFSPRVVCNRNCKTVLISAHCNIFMRSNFQTFHKALGVKYCSYDITAKTMVLLPLQVD